jgi:hypothetical protein
MHPYLVADSKSSFSLCTPAILAVVQPKFIEPIGEVLEDFEAPGFHPNEHVGNAGLDADALVLELGVSGQHVQALRLILFRERNASTFQRLAPAVARPRRRAA